MRRREASKPIRLALEQGLIGEGVSVFDYGCGHGADVRHLRACGVECAGWDPVHEASTPLAEADVVNLGYVVNVIESANERAETLCRAWALARRLLVVSGRLVHEQGRLSSGSNCEDGLLTARGTFQKFFDQNELRSWIEQTLAAEAVAAAPGIFFVFRSPIERETFIASRCRRRAAVPALRRSETLYRDHVALLAPLLAFMEDRGRPPRDGELADEEELRSTFGSVRRAVSVLRRVFGDDRWNDIAMDRREDLLVYLALKRFGGRQRATDLPVILRNDVRFHFGSYSRACGDADQLLYSVGNRELLEATMTASSLGKLTPGALYVHADYISALDPVLRVYEGCARALIGDLPDANILKLSREKFQVSYLTYPKFDSDPHPRLHHSVVVRMRDLAVKYRFFDESPNPPVLHRKETFLAPTDTRYEKFHRLTDQEDRRGLLDAPNDIGTLEGWSARLRAHGVRLSGHRVTRVRSAPP